MYHVPPFACLALIAAVSCAFGLEAGNAAMIAIGGPRKVTAEVVQDAENFDVAVRMIGVRAFDRATNDRCNREKATGYAIAALTQHLVPGERKALLRIRGQEVIDSGYDGKIFRLALRVPRDGVAITHAQRRPPIEKRNAERADASAEAEQAPEAGDTSSLFTVKQDYLDTIGVLSAKWRERLPSKGENKADADGFYQLIADAEEGIAGDFTALANEVKADKKLLSIEAKEVLTVAHDKEDELVDQLTERVKAFDKERE